MTDEPGHEFTRGLYGWITHTELSSTDPEATREWCAEVLGWKFPAAVSEPGRRLPPVCLFGIGRRRDQAHRAGRVAGVDAHCACRGHAGGLRRSPGCRR